MKKIHKTAIVDKGAIIGKETKVWHWSHICSKAKIGNNCSIGQNVYIDNNVVIGNNCKIQNNVSIYDGVELGNNVFCGPSMVFTNVINPRSQIDRKHEFLKTIVEEGVTFGANSTIICGVRINKYAFIAAGSVVTKNIKSYSLIVGSPGVQVAWICREGYKLNLPLKGSHASIISKSGIKYVVENNHCKSELDF